MNKILILMGLLILCGLLIFGCTGTPKIDSNKITDTNQQFAVCADKNKHMVITQSVEGETWECV